MVKIDDNILEALSSIKNLSTPSDDPPAKKGNDSEKLFLEKTAHLKNYLTDKPTIVLDAGHGFGNVNGVVKLMHGTWKKLDDGSIVTESDKTMEYTLRAKEMFEAEGCNVIINLGTRENPLPNQFENRIKTALDNDAAVFLSIHFNYNRASHLAGPEIYVANNVAGAKSGKFADYTPLARELGGSLAESMDARHGKVLSHKNYIVVSYNNKASSHSDLSHAPTTAAVLVEMGYFSNDEDFKRLNTPEYRDELLCKMVSGTMQHIQQQRQKYQTLLAEHIGIQPESERIRLADIEPLSTKNILKEFPTPSIPLEIRLTENDISFKR
jgi:N-acetylmuramoyl-L-alanine amidase